MILHNVPNDYERGLVKFKAMLHDIHMKPMDEQKKVMEKTLADWMSETDQVDDILVIGVRI